MRRKIIQWIKKQVESAKAKGIVLGLSGGIDSAVVAVLAMQALGRDKVLGLILPCHSTKQDALDARLLAKTYKIKTQTIDLSKTYDTLLSILPKADRMAEANIRPRLRMTVLYYFAKKLNYLVGGTGNKSEILTGYFTKHGDGATDILAIGNLTKTQVRKLAEELKIPRAVIDKAPSAGLWLNQTDEGEMGITYPELDDIICRIEKKQKQVLSKEKVIKVKKMIKNSEHKRKLPEICKI